MQKVTQKKVVIATALLAVVIFFYFFVMLNGFFSRPLVEKGVQTSIKVYPNQPVSMLLQRLHEKNVIHHFIFFEWMVRLVDAEHHLRFGEYQIQYPITAWQLLRHMTTGTGLVKHRFTIVNGWTYQDIRDAISKDANFNAASVVQSNLQVMQSLQSFYAHPEGLFYPDTYFFTWGNSEMTVLKMAYQKMQTTLQQAWQHRASNLPYEDAYQALIVASLIERETALDSEKPTIASVILNRLKKKMRLQIDPSVLYGLKKSFGVPITKTDLQSKTPYNTYQIKGLPPTPICMPSQSSLEAALHPATTDYLYYVANGKGGHNFSKTFPEHLIQSKAYQRTVSANEVDASKTSKP
ncbi:MAG: endolytic transglycosylase MltG [Gammaproteobacteria bacterium CG_4_10_14_0_8_um_filter_38_16]|nr:MAG: endolytic transglycosylase MltG [Gammaproteobacteria bacterium CG_4_10_14_0_8_um_filter_38_16]PJA03617.1 MAG: endolytic transglycosylase MltG [Gammaproteobacteria bacterium CG_4_10_14_0_2_um_filter_38_22]PJB10437.1 MAG: endolytic transglycosylase MltG [Gammaproteobacteria bacterium CG_4_9_14_3_um_filter_38_9]